MNNYFKTKKVSLAAIKGKNEGELPVQITIGKEKVILTKEEIAELAEALIKRATGAVSSTPEKEETEKQQ